jgi:TPP-dependent trihydroxycyclohexane-1,2-dione (THcHDO) dehydratase
VSRYFDRITRAEQLLGALPRAMAVLRYSSAQPSRQITAMGFGGSG